MTASVMKRDDSAQPELDPNIRLRDILKTLPRECFQKNPVKAWTSVLINILMVVLGYGAIAISPWYLLPCAWIFTGTALTGFFVIGHDCGHRSFSNRRWVNNWLGHIIMLPLIYPFHCWRILHDYHHTHTNKMEFDNAWQPIRPNVYDRFPMVGKWSYKFMRGRFWWLASIVHWVGLHFNLNQFDRKDKSKAIVSIAVVVIFAAIAFPLLIATTGLWGFVKFWLVPWLVYHFWMSTFTLVHHTDPEVQFYPPEAWNEALSQLSGTIHCAYPRWVEFLCHDINVHVPHHISTGIPAYNLRMAHRSLRQNWGAYLREERFSWHMMQKIVDHCHIYHPTDCYDSFKAHRNRSI